MASLHIGVEETKDDFGSGENNYRQPRHYHEVHRTAVGGGGGGRIGGKHGDEVPHQSHSNPCDASDGVQGVFEIITKNIFGSCGNVVEAASFFVQSSFQRSPPPNRHHPTTMRCEPVPNFGPATNIGQPQRRRKIDPLARFAGRYQSKALNPTPNGNPNEISNPERTDLPPYLAGETIAYSFDDNISALSAHTLEEMAKKRDFAPPSKAADHHPYLHHPPPSPTRTSSTSSESQSSIQDRPSSSRSLKSKKRSSHSSQRLTGETL